MSFVDHLASFAIRPCCLLLLAACTLSSAAATATATANRVQVNPVYSYRLSSGTPQMLNANYDSLDLALAAYNHHLSTLEYPAQPQSLYQSLVARNPRPAPGTSYTNGMANDYVIDVSFIERRTGKREAWIGEPWAGLMFACADKAFPAEQTTWNGNRRTTACARAGASQIASLGAQSVPSLTGGSAPALRQRELGSQHAPSRAASPASNFTRSKQGATYALYYIHTDHLGTPRAITRPSDNAIVWKWDNNEPFGNSQPNENPSGLGNFEYNLGFPGMYRDKETGTFYNYFRNYDPGTGRYRQSDPIGLAGGLNTYAYVSGSPLGSTDPLGLAQCTYSITRKVFACRPNDPGFVGPPLGIDPRFTFSGTGECRDKIECADRPNEGPVPPETYTMQKHPDKPFNYNLVPLPGSQNQPGLFCRLGFNRCNFQFHLGYTSLGCLNVTKSDDDARKQFYKINELLVRDAPNTLTVTP